MSARFEFWLSGPMPEEPSFGPRSIMRAIEPEEMLMRLVTTLKGAGYPVRSYSYECVLDSVQVAAPGEILVGLGALTDRQREVILEEIERRRAVSHLASTVEVAAADSTEPQGETHE